MTKRGRNQTQTPGIDQAAVLPELTVEFWLERFKTAAKRYKSLVEIADLLAEVDDEFKGAKGYISLQNIQNGRSSPQKTSRAALLMESIRPANKEANRLAKLAQRQKLVHTSK